MLYWILAILLIILIIIVTACYKRRAAKAALLSEIRNKWGKPLPGKRSIELISIYKAAYDDGDGISAATAADIDLENIFAYIDRTNSKPGQQYLYKKLHEPALATNLLSEMDSKIAELAKERSKQERIEIELSKLNTTNAYYLPELFIKKQAPLFSPLLTSYIQISWIVIITLIVLLTQVTSQVYFLLLIALLLTNTILHYKNKGKIAVYTHSLPQLLTLTNVADWMVKNVEVNRDESILNDLLKLRKLKRSLSFVNFQNGVSSDPTDIFSAIFELIKTVFLLESMMFISSIKKVNKYQAEIKEIYEYVGEIDTLIAIDSVRISMPYFTRPQFTSDGVLNVADLYHPLVEDCVPNSMFSSIDKGILVTGSNMSGKTTFIRAIAINALLAQTIYTCCAQSYRVPLLKIHTSIRVSDDIEEHKSYFQAEALAVLNIVNRCGINEPVPGLVIIDEIFRGTNTIERIAAAKSVLSYLTANRNFVFVSTHDLELAELLGDDYAIYSFEETVSEKRLIFDYKIKEGLLKNKNGIAILQAIEYPESIVKDAVTVSEQLRKKYLL